MISQVATSVPGSRDRPLKRSAMLMRLNSHGVTAIDACVIADKFRKTTPGYDATCYHMMGFPPINAAGCDQPLPHTFPSSRRWDAPSWRGPSSKVNTLRLFGFIRSPSGPLTRRLECPSPATPLTLQQNVLSIRRVPSNTISARSRLSPGWLRVSFIPEWLTAMNVHTKRLSPQDYQGWCPFVTRRMKPRKAAAKYLPNR